MHRAASAVADCGDAPWVTFVRPDPGMCTVHEGRYHDRTASDVLAHIDAVLPPLRPADRVIFNIPLVLEWSDAPASVAVLARHMDDPKEGAKDLARAFTVRQARHDGNLVGDVEKLASHLEREIWQYRRHLETHMRHQPPPAPRTNAALA